MPNRTPSSKPTAAPSALIEEKPQASSYFSRRTLQRALRLTIAFLLTLYFGIAVTVLVLRYAVLPHLEVWRPHIEKLATRALHAPVSIGTLQGNWEGFQPNITITQLNVHDQLGTPALIVPKAVATLSWRSLLLLKPVLSSLRIDAPVIKAHRALDGSFSVAGIPFKVSNQRNSNDFVSWVLTQQAVVLHNGTVDWHDATHATPSVTVTGLQFAVLNYRQQHRLGLQAKIKDGPIAGPVDLRVRFRHRILTGVSSSNDWSGTAYLRTGTIDLPALNRFIKLPFSAKSGQINAQTWFKFSHGRIQGLSGGFTADSLVLQATPQLPTLHLPKLSLIYRAQHIDNEFSLQIRNLSMKLSGPLGASHSTPMVQSFTANQFDSRYRAPKLKRGKKTGERFSIKGDFLKLGLFAELAQALPLPHSIITTLDSYKPEGILRDYTIEGEFGARTRETAMQNAELAIPFVRYRVKADFENASVAALASSAQPNSEHHQASGRPGFTHLSGSLDATERHGELKLASRATSITLPHWLDVPKLDFDTLRGEAQWIFKNSRLSSTLEVQLNAFSFANADAAGIVDVTYAQNNRYPGKLNLHARFSRAAVARIPRYLPTTLSKELRSYLSHALVAGTAHDATLQIDGPVNTFPFQHPNTPGTFRIIAPFEHGRFNPAPQQSISSDQIPAWPTLDEINGVFEINRNLLKIDVKQAHYRGVTIAPVKGQISNLAASTNLIIEGRASGPLNDMLDYFSHTPIPTWTGFPADKLRATENANLALRLNIPCGGHSSIKADGTLDFLNNSLSFGTLPTLNALNGQLKFTERSLSLQPMSAQLLGGNVRFSGKVKPSGEITIDAAGHLSTDALSKSLTKQTGRSPLALLVQKLAGNAPYQVNLRASKDSPPTITASANLDKVAIHLPAPFAKTAQQPMVLRFAVQPVKQQSVINAAHSPSESSAADEIQAQPLVDDLSKIDLQLGPLHAVYLRRGGKQPEILSGALSLNRATALPEHGVIATAHFPHFDLEAWNAVIEELHFASSAFAKPSRPDDSLLGVSSASYLPTAFNLHFNTLTFANRRWPDFTARAWHKHQSWHGYVTAPNIAGRLAWHPPSAQSTAHPSGMLTARLTRLIVPSAMQRTVSTSAGIGKRIDNAPSLDLTIDKLSIHERELGRLEMVAHNTTNPTTGGSTAWQLNKLQLSQPAAQLTATGSWQAIPQSQSRQTNFDFKLNLDNAGTLLNNAGLPRTLRDGKGTLSGHLSWRGQQLAPIDYATLDGTLALDLQRGQIVKVNPGAGKLIGVLSLQSLARFLTLDFRELKGSGLAFEKVTASAAIDQGVVRTDNFKIASSFAQINVKGSADLAKEQQDLLVTIKPTINANSAVLAAAVVNPLLGVGSYLAQQVISASVSRNLSTQYSVSGSWNNPSIERINNQSK